MTSEIDLYFFQRINQLAGKWAWLDKITIFFAQYCEYFLFFILLFFLFVNYKKYWKMVFSALIAAFLTRFVIVSIIRYFLPRSRPALEIAVNLLLVNPQSNSFPSGHAAFYFALSSVIFLYNRKIGLWFFLVSFLIVISRVFVGVHWPSDILVGAFIGMIVGYLFNIFFQKTLQKF